MKRILTPTTGLCALITALCVYFSPSPIGSLVPTAHGQKSVRKAKKASSTEQVTAPEALPTTLFISEYIEGSSNNKAIELYNGTGATVSLVGYTLELYINGSTTASQSMVLSGNVANGDVWVLIHQSATLPALLAQFDDYNAAVINFTGNDAVVLKKNGVVVDSIGQVGNNPVPEWGSGLQSTLDNTLVRNSSVCGGDTNPLDVFDPATEWTGYAVDTTTFIGSHTASCAAPAPTLSINDVSSAEGNSGTTTFAFTVSLSSPAPTGGVTFDIATADGVALDGSPLSEDQDYAPSSLTGQSIPAGSSSYTFNVSVKGDLVVEPNETFFVNVTNISGATAADAQGQGTIVNDDIVTTAAPVSISGRVLTRDRRGINGATVSLTDQYGVVRNVRANSFGYFRFDGVPAGETYVVSVSAHRYRFSPRVLNASDEVAGMEISPE